MDSDCTDYYDDASYDDVDDGDDVNASSCKVITKDCLLAAQKEDLHKVMELLTLNENHARTLLIHNRWDVECVLDVFVNKGKDHLYKEACLTLHENGDISSSSQRSSSLTCGICIEEVPVYKMTTMDCGHCFCNNCWTEHFRVKINEGQSRRISCMAHKCNVVCDESKIRINLSEKDPDLAKKFDRHLLESYIEDNKRVKWCPSVPHCGYAIRVDYDEYCEVECACGVRFCFSCSSEAHSPCSCKMLELWTQKCGDDDFGTENWKAINTKNCPKCHKPVEKNGGCNLVCCICGQAFCWLCGGATGLQHTWESIEGHTCGRYKEDHKAKADRALRYVHYHDRFQAHKDSLKAEIGLKETLESKISTIKARDNNIMDLSWLIDGVDRLAISRRILSYSYPFAYFMFGDVFLQEEMTDVGRIVKQNLFENQQQDLECQIEKLSLFLAESFDEYPNEKFNELKRKMVVLCDVVDLHCKNLYDCIDKEILHDLVTTVCIAPYRSKGADKALEFNDDS